MDGRPVWKPPIFEHAYWIDETYEKRRKAMLEYKEGDRARTTEIMDNDAGFRPANGLSALGGGRMESRDMPRKQRLLWSH